MTYNNSIEYPFISPLRWVEPLSEARYLRTMGTADVWRVQFLSDNDLSDTFVLRVYSTNYGFYLCEFAFTKSTLTAGRYYWDAYPDGTTIQNAITALNLHYLDSCVTFKIEKREGVSEPYTYTVWADSTPVSVGTFLDTKEIMVWNSTNDMSTVFGEFDWDNLFSFRVEAKWENMYYQLHGDYETFEDQEHQLTVFNASPAGKYVLTIGDESGLDDSMIQQIQWFLSCEAILIDFVHYVRMSMEEVTNENRGTRQLKVTLMPATNRSTQNVLGEETYITDESSNVIEAVLDGDDKLLIL